MKLKILAVIAAIFVLGGIAVAQTLYTTPEFSASFNGPVSIMGPAHSASAHATDTMYTSEVDSVMESVIVRITEKDIPVSWKSSDYYAQSDFTGLGVPCHTERDGTPTPTSTLDHGFYQGHPSTYDCTDYTEGGVIMWQRVQYIIVGPRETVWVIMRSPREKSSRDEWSRFWNSVDINCPEDKSTIDVSGKWILTGLDSAPGIVRLTTAPSGWFKGKYTAGLEEDGFSCDIKDGKVNKAGKVSFTFVCGSDEIEAKIIGHITEDGSIIKGSVNGKYITMTRAK